MEQSEIKRLMRKSKTGQGLSDIELQLLTSEWENNPSRYGVLKQSVDEEIMNEINPLYER